MKKLFCLIALGALTLSACGAEKEAPLMDEIGSDGNYHYENQGLGFGLVLPPDFIYFQTQRKTIGDTILLEIFVPTKDQDYPQEIQSYGKPVTVALFTQEYWDGLLEDEDEKMFYTEIARQNGQVYGLRPWSRVPSDWKQIWNEQYWEKIKDGFYLTN